MSVRDTPGPLSVYSMSVGTGLIEREKSVPVGTSLSERESVAVGTRLIERTSGPVGTGMIEMKSMPVDLDVEWHV